MSINDIAERVHEAYKKAPSKMTSALARELGIPEAEVVRHLPENRSCEMDPTLWEGLIRSFQELGKVHVICTNAAVTLEAFGQFGEFSTFGEFFNVQTPSLDMHIRSTQIGSIFAVEKRSHMDGHNTLSFQFYDKAGNSAFKVFLTFGGKEPNAERTSQFESLRRKYALKKNQ